ncbi:hypothetical protein H2199_009065 [Coniosporium tulheliwenetii]|uniref:Uncharacterized protein n=1 Tax=Coniosporium tulheliwenetii TaxID=3383036 RepID=A0ACC2YFQ9_9PEZI|nr:hypothetical protein H2199_009065 [Cladosporium sp. JES 115]
METIHLRPATPLPLHDNSSPTTNKHFIVFKHPGYPEDYEQNVLLQLYAWDSPNGGLHAGTALLACSLIACNAWDGYLTVERDGQKLDLQDDDILSAPEYYFHVPEPPTASADSTSSRNHYKYPIYPSFQHWAFPHRHVPSQWRGASGDEGGSVPDEPSSTPSVSSVSAAVIARDRACAISKHRDYIERAHLCPRNELDWFQKNGMRRYNARLDISGDVITDDMANALAMRADIHRAFDGCKFAFVRKAGRWVAHFLETTYELGRMYHNRPVEMAAGVAPEFVLARFAWSVFPLVKAFMEHGPERLVRVREVCEGGLREVVKTLDPVGFAQITGTTRGRSASPKSARLLKRYLQSWRRSVSADLLTIKLNRRLILQRKAANTRTIKARLASPPITAPICNLTSSQHLWIPFRQDPQAEAILKPTASPFFACESFESADRATAPSFAATTALPSAQTLWESQGSRSMEEGICVMSALA